MKPAGLNGYATMKNDRAASHLWRVRGAELGRAGPSRADLRRAG